MKTAKQFLQNKYPEMRGENWNITDVDDNWVAEQMELFANEKANAVLREAAKQINDFKYVRQNPEFTRGYEMAKYDFIQLVQSLQTKK